MPQLDFFSIANQFTWGIFYFLLFYFIVNTFVIPTIFASIFAREFVLKNSSTDNFENIFYGFTAFFVFNTIISEISEINSSIFSEMLAADFSNFVLISTLVEHELALTTFYVFEELDTNI